MIPAKLGWGDEVRVVSPATSLGFIPVEQRRNAQERWEGLGLGCSFSRNVEVLDQFEPSPVEARLRPARGLCGPWPQGHALHPGLLQQQRAPRLSGLRPDPGLPQGPLRLLGHHRPRDGHLRQDRLHDLLGPAILDPRHEVRPRLHAEVLRAVRDARGALRGAARGPLERRSLVRGPGEPRPRPQPRLRGRSTKARRRAGCSEATWAPCACSSAPRTCRTWRDQYSSSRTTKRKTPSTSTGIYNP